MVKEKKLLDNQQLYGRIRKERMTDCLIFNNGAFLVRVKNVPEFVSANDIIRDYAKKYGFYPERLSCIFITPFNSISYMEMKTC